jgi:hypothetical protein
MKMNENAKLIKELDAKRDQLLNAPIPEWQNGSEMLERVIEINMKINELK